MNYYHNLITTKSWQALLSLKEKYDFILIGGWAVYLYTRGLKSKDIDCVVEYSELEKLKKEFVVSKNLRLKKYEARKEEIEIDIYVPYYSNPGLPAEDLKNFMVVTEGFKTVKAEVLAILKEKALMDRAHSPKGRKDLIDLISLFALTDFDWEGYKKIIARSNLSSYSKYTKEIIQNTPQVPEVGLNIHKMARFKKKVLPLL